MHLQNEFIAHLRRAYPGLNLQPLQDLVSENLISPFQIRLPASVLRQTQTIIAAAFALRESPTYQAHYFGQLQAAGILDPGNKSIMMSYDFHVDESQNLKLIEINTNASFMVLGYEMYRMLKIPLPVADFKLEEFRSMIQTELNLFGRDSSKPSIVIADENPSEQRLYIEFLVYQELFKSFGWPTRISDYREIFKTNGPDFIYNRYTDFMLNDESSRILRQKYLAKEVCLSPNPFEYFLLADKQRMIDWCDSGFLESMDITSAEVVALRAMLPAAHDLQATNKEQLWQDRKKLFFKPKRAFGSKLSYRGSSISRKHFDALDGEEMVAQEFVAPGEQSFKTPAGPQNFKYDLRCYAYQGRLQLIVARLYQGQVTNLRTPLGGFGAVIFSGE